MGKWGANLGLLVVATTWGTVVPIIGYLAQVWDPFFLGSLRYCAGAPVLLLLLWWQERGRIGLPRIAWWRPALLGTIGLGLFAPLYTVGVAHANPIVAAVLSAANPVVAAIVAWLSFREPINHRMIPAIILAVIGCSLATVDFSKLSESGSVFVLRGGEILILAAACCWTWYSISAQRWLQGWSQLRISASTIGGGVPMLLGVYLAAGKVGWAQIPPAMPPDAWHVVLLCWLTFASIVLCVLLWNYGVRQVGVVVATMYLNLVPIVALAILAIMGTIPSLQQVLGAALVILGILYSEWQQYRHRRRQALVAA
ncbi:MAG TPA: DMT family transporter [Terriglobales bacterium]|nr:DMT family transporter [Terriglobales bacterium]